MPKTAIPGFQMPPKARRRIRSGDLADGRRGEPGLPGDLQLVGVALVAVMAWKRPNVARATLPLNAVFLLLLVLPLVAEQSEVRGGPRPLRFADLAEGAAGRKVAEKEFDLCRNAGKLANLITASVARCSRRVAPIR